MAKRKILWVEDDQDWCRRMEGTFGRKYDIVFVHNRDGAISVLKEQYNDFSLAVIDLHLGGAGSVEGISVIKNIKSDYSTLPVVVVTNGSLLEGRRAEEAGAWEVLPKDGIDAEEWVSIFERVMKPRVFISHSSVDKPFVRKLKKELEPYCFKVWFDEDDIRVGDSIPKKIGNGLEEANRLIIVLSPEAVASNWVKLELENAHYRFTQIDRGSIIPIVFRECKIPGFISHYKRFYWEEFSQSFEKQLEIERKELSSRLLWVNDNEIKDLNNRILTFIKEYKSILVRSLLSVDF